MGSKPRPLGNVAKHLVSLAYEESVVIERAVTPILNGEKLTETDLARRAGKIAASAQKIARLMVEVGAPKRDA